MMNKIILATLLCLVALTGTMPTAWAKAPAKVVKVDDEMLRQQGYDIKHMWALSQAYQHGFGVKQDPILAYAWMMAYVQALPKDYPGLWTMLDNTGAQLSKAERRQGYFLYKKLIAQYALHFKLDETQLSRLFVLDNAKTSVMAVSDSLPILPKTADAVLAKLNDNKRMQLAHNFQQQLNDAQALQRDEPGSLIVFGQVLVPRERDPRMVLTKANVLKDGYFVTSIKPNQPLAFRLNGFKPLDIYINKNPSEAIINLGSINLQPLDKKDETGFIASIKLAHSKKLTANDFMLKMQDSEAEALSTRPAWFKESIPLKVVPQNSQVYAKHLSPGDYTLYIRNPDTNEVIKKPLHLMAGETQRLDIG